MAREDNPSTLGNPAAATAANQRPIDLVNQKPSNPLNQKPSNLLRQRSQQTARSYVTATRTLSNPALADEDHDDHDNANNNNDDGTERPERGTKYDRGWRRIVRNFSPSWFSVTMGTGMVSLLLNSIPFKANWLYWLAVLFFCLNVCLFLLASGISLLRYTLYPEIWTVMLSDSTNSLFLGTCPMGFATLINAWIQLCVPYWGEWSVTFAWVCWMVDAVAAIAVTLSISILLFSTPHVQALHRITATQLLPIATTVVAAGAGANIAAELKNPNHAFATIIACYVMLGMSLPMALTVLVMYYQRLVLHKLPPREVVVSSFLPLGPLGAGGYAIIKLGSDALKVFPKVHLFDTQGAGLAVLAGNFFFVGGVLTALIMWGFGLVWLVFALSTIYKSRPFPFNMGWWGFTFPTGVYALSTIEFGVKMPSLFFRVLGTVIAVMVILLWCVVAAGTCWGAWEGRLFIAPCLAQLNKEREGRKTEDKENGDVEKGDEDEDGEDDEDEI